MSFEIYIEEVFKKLYESLKINHILFNRFKCDLQFINQKYWSKDGFVLVFYNGYNIAFNLKTIEEAYHCGVSALRAANILISDVQNLFVKEFVLR